MSDSRGDVTGEVPTLQRLGTVVRQRSAGTIWKAFLVAQVCLRDTQRRREMTTQRIFLTGEQP